MLPPITTADRCTATGSATSGVIGSTTRRPLAPEAMSVHLIGGGRDLELAETVYGPFVAQTRLRAARRGRANPRIAVVIVAEQAGYTLALERAVDWFRQALARSGEIAVEPATAAEDQEDPLRLIDGSTPDTTFFEDLDGLLVGGGLPPAYHRGAPAARRCDPCRRHARRCAVRGVLRRRDDRSATGPARRMAARLHGGDARGQR